jgi:hypothetical protein
VILGYAAVYLGVMSLLWLSALPAWFGAADGVTADGDPIGSLWYIVACLAIAVAALAAAASVRPTAPAHVGESTHTQAPT